LRHGDRYLCHDHQPCRRPDRRADRPAPSPRGAAMSLANVQLERSISRRAALNLPLLIGSIGTAAFVLSAVVAPWLAPFDPQTMAPASRFAAASASHLLGTDEYGRD